MEAAIKRTTAGMAEGCGMPDLPPSLRALKKSWSPGCFPQERSALCSVFLLQLNRHRGTASLLVCTPGARGLEEAGQPGPRAQQPPCTQPQPRNCPSLATVKPGWAAGHCFSIQHQLGPGFAAAPSAHPVLRGQAPASCTLGFLVPDPGFGCVWMSALGFLWLFPSS